jgi:hypothetical protein
MKSDLHGKVLVFPYPVIRTPYPDLPLPSPPYPDSLLVCVAVR